MSDDFRVWQKGQNERKGLDFLYKQAYTIDPSRAISIWNSNCPSSGPIKFMKDVEPVVKA